MTDSTAQNRKAGCPRWVKIALVLSLVVNVAAVGLFVGAGMKEDERKRGLNNQIRWIIELAPEEHRDLTKAKFDAQRDAIRKTRADRARHMDAIVVAIRADPFSPEALEYAMRLRREASTERHLIVHTTLVEVLSDFSQDDRIEFADALEERLEAWAKKRQQSQ